MMIVSRNFVAALLAGLLGTASVGHTADLTLLERVNDFGAVIRLGDIADIAATDSAASARLADLPLMPAPAPGGQATITAQGVRELIVASGVDLNTLRFSGAIRIQIGAASTTQRQPAPPTEPQIIEPPIIEPQIIEPPTVCLLYTSPSPRDS